METTMTRLAVLSDIHGNLPALEAVMKDMDSYKIDHVVVAGDHINWGPFSRQVMEIITAQNWAILRGNNEFYQLDYDTSRAPKHWSSFTLPPVIHEQLGNKWLNIIASLPDSLSLRFRDAPPIRIVHGIPDNPWQAIFPQTPHETVCEWLKDVPELTLIGAHSHIPMERHIDRWHIFNAGSVGVPLDGEFTASYMILEGRQEGWTLEGHRRIPFDYAPLYAEFERQRFEERCGATGRLVVEEFRTARLQVHPFHRWLHTTHPNQPETDTRVDEFLQLDDISDYLPAEYQDLDTRLYRD
jgi:predicted phosphodiesterase